MAILAYVFENGWESDFSFAGVERMALQKWRTIMETPVTPEQEDEARKILEKMEHSRQQSMERYERDGLPPFMRSPSASLPDEEPPPSTVLPPS
jgi:hypothetical protein